jgi:hypothetical protein
MNSVLKTLIKKEGYTKSEAVKVVLEEFEECGRDYEETLFQLGFELDYASDLIDIVATRS